jgi:hypothetical protein
MSDVTEIKQLKYRYLRCVDMHLWDELAETLAEDVTASYGARLSFDSRDAVVAGLAEQMTSDVITEHRVSHPEIDVDGDTATGRWYLQDRVIVPAFSTMIFGAAFYADEYRRVDGRWVISRTGYTRTYEAMIDLKDIPSFQLTENHLIG